MRRKDALDAYQDYTRQTSANTRQLSYALMGVIWVLGGGPNLQPSDLPTLLGWAAVWAVAALLFDFFHYFGAAVIWGRFHRQLEKQEVPQDREIKAPAAHNWFGNACWGLKVASIVAGYVVLGIHVLST